MTTTPTPPKAPSAARPAETWHVELGNEAVLAATLVYQGTEAGAVRYAARLARETLGARYGAGASAPRVTSVDLRRPGCRTLRTWAVRS